MLTGCGLELPSAITSDPGGDKKLMACVGALLQTVALQYRGAAELRAPVTVCRQAAASHAAKTASAVCKALAHGLDTPNALLWVDRGSQVGRPKGAGRKQEARDVHRLTAGVYKSSLSLTRCPRSAKHCSNTLYHSVRVVEAKVGSGGCVGCSAYQCLMQISN